MERALTNDYAEVQGVNYKFKVLSARFTAEVAYHDHSTYRIMEAILTEVVDTTVDALLESGGNEDVMRALELEFTSKILAKAAPPGWLDVRFRQLLIQIAIKVAQRASGI